MAYITDSPPSLPDVYDEAGDSPNWVPALGAALLVLLSLVFAARVALHKELPPSAAPTAPVSGSAPEAPAGPLPASS